MKICARIYLIVLGLLLPALLPAQVVWQELFSYPDGTTQGANNNGANPAPDWVAVCTSCVSGDWFEVRSNRLEGKDTNGPAAMLTETIDISAFTTGVEILVELSEDGGMEDCPGGVSSGCNSVDWIRIETQLDNNPYQDYSSPIGGVCTGPCAGGNYVTLGDFGTYTFEECPLIGNSLRIRITVQCWSASEYLRINSILVRGQNCDRPILRANLTDILCPGGQDGIIEALVTGGTPPYQFSLNGSPFQASPTFNGLPPGPYTLIVEDANGLRDTLNNLVLAEPSGFVARDSVISVSCPGLADGEIHIPGISGGVPPFIYSLDGAPFQGGASFTGLSAGSYTLVIQDFTFCPDTLTIIVDANPGVSPGLFGQDAYCDGSPGFAWSMPSGGTSPYSFVWGTQPPQTGDTAFGLVAGLYSLAVTDSRNCTGTDSILLGNGALQVADAGQDTVLCGGDSVLLVPVIRGAHAPGYSFSWWSPDGLLNPAGPDSIWVAPQQSSFFWVTGTDSSGNCETEPDSLWITVETPFFHPVPSGMEYCPGEPVPIGLSPLPHFSYSWSPEANLQSPGQSLTFAMVNSPITYTLTITSDTLSTAGCRSQQFSVPLTEGDCQLPNVITPNGDQVNDVLDLGPEHYGVRLSIFDRWGSLIYHADSYQNDWRGQNLRGKEIPEGVYYYWIESKEGWGSDFGALPSNRLRKVVALTVLR